jgi:sensor domain CHASE-containing protein
MNARPTRQQPIQSFLASPVGVAQGVALITVIVLLLIGLLANRAYADHLLNQLREQVTADLQRDEIGIRAAMARYHATLLALQAHVLAEDQEDFDDFQRFVSTLFKAQRGIDSLRLLPDQGRPIVYPPFERNTTLLIDSSPESQADIRRAMETGRAVLSPVYVRPDEDGTLGLTLRLNVRELNGQYWGQVALDFDAAVILDESGLTSTERNLRIGLRDSNGMALLGESGLLKADPVQVQVELPGVTWTLLGIPLEGWDAALALALGPVQGVGLLVIVLGGMVAYQVTLRQRGSDWPSGSAPPRSPASTPNCARTSSAASAPKRPSRPPSRAFGGHSPMPRWAWR